MTTISPLHASDRDDWLPLWRGYLDFYETPLGDEQSALTFERLTDAAFPLHGALARSRGTRAAVGLVHWLAHPNTWREGEYCYLEDLFVAPDARGAGVARDLIAHVREWAEASGCSKMYWLTAATNTRARGLYDRVAMHTGMVQYQIAL